MAKRDYYEVLGVERTTTVVELKKAYRRLAMKHHPDRNPGDKASEELFKEANEAYEVLSDTSKRAAYDQYGHAAFDPNSGGFGGHTYTQQNGPFNFTYTQVGNAGGSDFDFGGFSNPFDIFEQFFGGGGFSQQRQSKRLETYKISISFFIRCKLIIL